MKEQHRSRLMKALCLSVISFYLGVGGTLVALVASSIDLWDISIRNTQDMSIRNTQTAMQIILHSFHLYIISQSHLSLPLWTESIQSFKKSQKKNQQQQWQILFIILGFQFCNFCFCFSQVLAPGCMQVNLIWHWITMQRLARLRSRLWEKKWNVLCFRIRATPPL